MKLFAIVLALIAFRPIQTMAKAGPGGGGGGGSGGNQSGSMHVGIGSNAGFNRGMQPNTGALHGQAAIQHQAFDAQRRSDLSGGTGEGRDSWRYRLDDGRWWFWGPDNRWMWYSDDGQWQYYGNEYVVRRPILQTFSGGLIKIVNPSKSGTTLAYTLDGQTYTMPPGYSQTFQADRAWVIQFSRGPNLDQVQYGLETGVYKFTHTNHGWELYHSPFPQSVTPQAPIAARTSVSPR